MGNSTEFLFNPQIIATLVFLIKLYNYCRTHLNNYIQFYICNWKIWDASLSMPSICTLFYKLLYIYWKTCCPEQLYSLVWLSRNLHRWAHEVFGASVVQFNGVSWSRSMYQRGYIIKRLYNLKLSLIIAMNKAILHELNTRFSVKCLKL